MPNSQPLPSFRRPLFAGICVLALAAVAVAAAPRANAAGKAGSIKGTVAFAGKSDIRKLRVPIPYCAKEKPEDRRVVASGGGLEDVHVSLEGPGLKGKAPGQPVLVDQTGCEYKPRVSGAVAGQAIKIRNSDGTLHNVHGYQDGQTAFNLAQPKGAKDIERKVQGKTTLELKCDVHRWMRAYVRITEHPYFAVSGSGGSFEIKGVPPGSYTLRAWHPVLGEKTAKVTVKPGKAAKAKIQF